VVTDVTTRARFGPLNQSTHRWTAALFAPVAGYRLRFGRPYSLPASPLNVLTAVNYSYEPRWRILQCQH